MSNAMKSHMNDCASMSYVFVPGMKGRKCGYQRKNSVVA